MNEQRVEAARPVDPAEWSLKTEQRVIEGPSRPSITRARPPPIMHRAGVDNSVMSAAALCTRWQ